MSASRPSLNVSFDKSRFDALMALADFRQKRDHSRRELAWRFSLALWAVLGASPLYIIRRPPEVVLDVILVVTVIAHAWFWVNEIRLRGRRDVELAFYYIDRAEDMVLGGMKFQPRPDFKGNKFYKFGEDVWSSGLQMLVTAAVALIAWYLIGSNLLKISTT